MKIAHLCLACFYIEGYEYQENILPRKHKQSGNEVTIITSQYSFDENKNEYDRSVGDYMNVDNIPVTVLGYDQRYKKFSRAFRLYTGLFDKLQEIKPDIIFCHGTQFLSICELIKYKKRNTQVRIISDQHIDHVNSGVLLSYKRRLQHRFFWGYFARKAAKYSEIIWGVTPLRVTFLRDIYRIPAAKTGLLVMGGDDDKIDFRNKERIRRRLREQHEIANDDFLIVTGGKIDEAKNTHLLMRAVAKINYSKMKLVVFGQPSAAMKQEIDALSQHDCIRNINWIPSEEVYNWFLAADLAVFPGTHSVLWEQACATPCVFKYWEGMTHVNVGGNCRFLYRDCAEEIEEVLLRVFSHPEEYKNMKKAAMENGVKEFSYSEIARRSIDPFYEFGGIVLDKKNRR